MNRGTIRAAFAQFAAFGQDAIDNKAYLTKGKLTMPVLACAGDWRRSLVRNGDGDGDAHRRPGARRR
jgi:hypothetical protein